MVARNQNDNGDDEETAEQIDHRIGQAEFNRLIVARLKSLEQFKRETRDTLDGNGRPQLIENSIYHRLGEHDSKIANLIRRTEIVEANDNPTNKNLDERLKKVEQLVSHGFKAVLGMAITGIGFLAKLLWGIGASLLTKDAPK
jgi:hypothetical protein